VSLSGQGSIINIRNRLWRHVVPKPNLQGIYSACRLRFDGRHGYEIERESIYGASVRAAAERAAGARKAADRLACQAWNKRMLGFQGPAQPSPALGDALNGGYGYLEVKCLGGEQS
jgi:hypothetical protein